MREALFMTCLVLTMSLSGCFGSEESPTTEDEDTLYPDIYSRHTLDWNWSDSYSYVLAVSYTHLTLPTKRIV